MIQKSDDGGSSEGGDEELNLRRLCSMADNLPVEYTQYKEKIHMRGF